MRRENRILGMILLTCFLALGVTGVAHCVGGESKTKAQNSAAKKELSEKELEKLWKQLAGKDAAKAFKAIGAMIQSPKQSVAFLKTHLKPIGKPNVKKIKKWIADLESDQFRVRQKAMYFLKKNVQVAVGFLTKAKAKAKSLEARLRIEKLLGEMELAKSPKLLQQYRAMEALEHIGNREAIALFKSLAKGEPNAFLTKEAKKCLARLLKKKK